MDWGGLGSDGSYWDGLGGHWGVYCKGMGGRLAELLVLPALYWFILGGLLGYTGLYQSILGVTGHSFDVIHTGEAPVGCAGGSSWASSWSIPVCTGPYWSILGVIGV